MSFRKVAFGLLLGTLPLAGSSLNAAGDAGLGAKVISGFKAAVSVDKGMVIATPGSGFDTLAVSIDFSGVFDTAAANEFVVELSDPQGSFAQNTTEIVRLTEAEDTVYGWIVPSTVADGDFYRVHVRSTLLDSVVGQSLQFRVRKEYEAEAQIPNSGFEVWQNEGMAEAEPLGWHSFKTASGTLSLKMTTRSTDCSAARTAARSSCLLMGRSSPFPSILTDESELTATMRLPPSARAWARYVTWPRCRMSKTPLVMTTGPGSSARRRARSDALTILFSKLGRGKCVLIEKLRFLSLFCWSNFALFH